MSKRKKIWWAALFAGLGGTLSLGVIWIVEGHPPPKPLIWAVWPVVLLCAGWVLRRCYRLEPLKQTGFWHLRLEYLMALSLYAGCLMALAQVFSPDHFLAVGMPFSLLHSVALVLGLLAAERAAIRGRSPKYLFALAFGSCLIGFIAAGALLFAIAMDAVAFGAPFFWLKQLCTSPDSRWPLQLHRLALLCLPIGAACMWMARRTQPDFKPHQGEGSLT